MADDAAQAAAATQAAAQAAAAKTETAQTQTEGDLASLPEWARKTIDRLNSEDAANRVKAKDRDALAAKLKTLEDAQLSEAEKLKNRATELEQAATQRDNELRQERAEREVERAARKLNIVDEETALALVRGRIEFDDAGKPTNIPKLLDQLVKDKPFLVGQAQGSPGNAGNGTRSGGGGALTLDDFKGKSSDWINAHWDDYVKLTTKR